MRGETGVEKVGSSWPSGQEMVAGAAQGARPRLSPVVPVQRVLAATHLTEAAVFATRHGAPFLLLVAAFTLLYRLLPYTRVSLQSALVGGVTAALLWHVAGFWFAVFVAGSTSYTAIYSGFAVFFISLIWLQLAWLVVLTGGQVAYVHQHPISYVVVRGRPSLLLRERIGLGALVEITRQYLGAAVPRGRWTWRVHSTLRWRCSKT